MLSITRSLVLSMPVLSMLLTAIYVMFADLFFPKFKLNRLVLFIGLGLSAVLCLNFYPGFKTAMWSELFTSDNLTYLMQFFIVLSLALSIYYAVARLDDLQASKGDVLCLYLLSAVGMMSLVAAENLLAIYLSLELSALPLYALVASQRQDAKAVEAGLKYFIMGALASVFILFGMSLLYGLSANLELDQIVNALSLEADTHHMMILFALIFLIAGASFKLALVPFHMWAPDVYAGANPVMSLFLSAAPKIAGLGIFIRLSTAGLFDVLPVAHQVLAVIAMTSILFGNLNALVQKDLRRLLAYSTIAHMGYALLGFVAGGEAGAGAALMYVLTYALMAVLAFSAIILSRNEATSLLTVNDLKGLARRTPWLAFMLMITFFSMAGIPPALGFMAKFLVIRVLLNSGYSVLAIFALLFAVIGAFYYLKLIKTMYFEFADEELPALDIHPIKKCVYSVNSLILLALGLFPNVLITACMQAF